MGTIGPSYNMLRELRCERDRWNAAKIGFGPVWLPPRARAGRITVFRTAVKRSGMDKLCEWD